MKKNIIYVTTDLSDKNLWSKKVKLENIHWITRYPTTSNRHCKVRLRYRGPLVDCNIKADELTLGNEQRAISSGQSAVIYQDSQCLGGGIIC